MTEALERIAAHWDGRAATFDDEIDHGLVGPVTRAAWARRLSTWLPAPPAQVVELGCGTGSLAVLLAERGYDVAASDISPTMIDRARAKAEAAGVAVDLEVADAASPPYADGSADIVLVRHLAWTLLDPEAAIATWASLLRPHGRLVMIEGRWGTPEQSGEADVDHGDYSPVHRSLPWYGGVAADTLVPALERVFGRVECQDLSGDDHLWGRPVSDERYVVMAEEPGSPV